MVVDVSHLHGSTLLFLGGNHVSPNPLLDSRLHINHAEYHDRMRFAGISSMSLVLFIWKIKFISKVDWEAILGMSSVHKRRIKSICHRTCPLQKVTEPSNCNTGLDDIQE